MITKNKDQIEEQKVFSGILESLLILGVLLFFSCGTVEDEDTASEIGPHNIELNSPVVQTPAPLIHLADNLDEPDKLGWCIDTQGIGFNEALHTHSCKPDGGDVQFYYNVETGQICSAEYIGFCLEMSGGPMPGMSLSLMEDKTDSFEQKFIYDVESGEFSPEWDSSLCLAAGATSANAGIYMSRTLTLELSSVTDKSLKQWVIVGNGTSD